MTQDTTVSCYEIGDILEARSVVWNGERLLRDCSYEEVMIVGKRLTEYDKWEYELFLLDADKSNKHSIGRHWNSYTQETLTRLFEIKQFAS